MITTSLLFLLSGCNRCSPLEAIGISGERTCPVGDLKLTADVRVTNVQRGAVGTLELDTFADWMVDLDRRSQLVHRPYDGDVKITATLEGTDAEVLLTALEPVKKGTRASRITIPDVPDGDHVLVLEVDGGFDKTSVRVPLAFYDPAVVHVLSDRPLYRAGEDVNLRSLVLSRADHTPLGSRPGRWIVRSPDNVELLNEVAKAGAWGVAATSLPLDPSAPNGVYTATYTSGVDSDTIRFEVKPFELPKITVDVNASRTWSGIGDEVAIEGVARYRSGAPIADAPLVATLFASGGAWPAPLEWTDPKPIRTRADGSFQLSWGEVPRDLRDRVTLTASVRVTEEGGESTTASTSLVLSQYPIHAVPMTELGTSLAAGENNRAYVRVMTPDGKPLPGTEVTLSNPWLPARKPRVATADEDGVIAVQIDPGDPVTLVDEPMPLRVRPAPPPKPADAPSVQSLRPSFNRSLTLKEQGALPLLERASKGCQHVEVGDQRVQVTLRTVAGKVRDAYAEPSDVTATCVAGALRGLVLPVGTETFKLDLQVPDSRLPYFQLSSDTVVGSSIDSLMQQAADRARTCLTPGQGASGETALSVHWMILEEQKRIAVDVAQDADAGLTGAQQACVARQVANLTLDEKAEASSIGTTRFDLVVPALPGVMAPPPPPKPTTRDGFELRLEVADAGRLVGSTPLRFTVGSMPALRVRATPPVVDAGGTVTFELLRSGAQDIELPKELALTQNGKEVARTELKENKAEFQLPPDVRGFVEARFLGQWARVFVQRTDRLALTLEPDRTSYRPGETAQITVTTTAGGVGHQAAVGLIGVDAALGQIATLPGPDEYGRVTITASSAEPAFGAFDARALLLGRIRGANARQAAVLRVSAIPVDRFERPLVSGSGTMRIPQDDALERAFEAAWAQTAVNVRAWERQAPEAEKLDNARMLKLWEKALADLRDEGKPAVDAFGRELKLRLLPEDKLKQLDPKLVVGDGTRIPEDTVSWVGWVAKEVTDG